jgi:putative nucleotidyltransferase with HDIG domain
MEKERIRDGWQEWLASNDRGWRIVVGILCAFCLALFLHFRDVRLEVLELNAAAGRYIVAQVDFEFPDYEATVVLKQQAMQDIGSIYQIDDKEVREARHDLENTLIHNKTWRQAAPLSTFEEMYKAVDETETLLLEARFTDARTIQKVKELNLPDTHYYEALDGLSSDGSLDAPFWEEIENQVMATGSFHPQTIRYVITAFKQRKWTLHEDSALERAIKAQVSRTVPEKYTKVQAGTRLIDQGELVTSRHLTMMQAMKQEISDSRKLWDPLTLLSSFALAALFVAISALYFRISQPSFVRNLQQISLFVCIVLLTLLFAKLTEYALVKSASPVLAAVRYPIVAPFATILICILLSPRTALFAATFLSIILSVSLAVDHSRFLILNLVTSIVVIIAAQNIRKRKEVFGICLKTWLSAILVLWTFSLSEGKIGSMSLATDIASSLAFLLLTAVFVVGLLPALETLFGVMTDMALIEYLDPQNELLQKLAIEVPGTYQHTLVLANLAEYCASAIGANGLFCRAATLYHDIGKTLNPQFFTENQQDQLNVHQLLSPIESAQVIIAHVTDGVLLARKYRLPQPFIDIIREHHGTTLVYYFYRKELERLGGHKEKIDEALFRYPGPRPRTKESAIIMICDTVEAASRSLDKITEPILSELVDRLIAEKAEEKQFDECQLTFEELTKVKRALVKSLLLAHHVRVKYPARPPTLPRPTP